MEVTPTETGWLTQSENNKEEIELVHFLKVHSHFSVSSTSTDEADEADCTEPSCSLTVARSD